jgi:hypothetical protein
MKPTWLCVELACVALWVGSAIATHAGDPPDFRLDGGVIQAAGPGYGLQVSLQAPRFCIDERPPVGGTAAQDIQGALTDGQVLEVAYPSIALEGGSTLEVKLFCCWSAAEAVLRKWARFRLAGAAQGAILKEVILDT